MFFPPHGLSLRLWIYLELMTVYGEKYESKLILLHAHLQFGQYHLPKKSTLVLPLGLYPQYLKIMNLRQVHTTLSIAALFTVAKIWIQPSCASSDKWWKKLWHIHMHTGTLSSYIEEWHSTICSKMDSVGGYDIMWKRAGPRKANITSYSLHVGTKI